MQAPRAARAVDQIIHKHLQDWDHDGSRFTWQEDGQDFTLATFFTPATPQQLTEEPLRKLVPHLTIHAAPPAGEEYLPYEYRGLFGCTTERTVEMAFWVKDFVEMNLSLQGLELAQ